MSVSVCCNGKLWTRDIQLLSIFSVTSVLKWVPEPAAALKEFWFTCKMLFVVIFILFQSRVLRGKRPLTCPCPLSNIIHPWVESFQGIWVVLKHASAWAKLSVMRFLTFHVAPFIYLVVYPMMSQESEANGWIEKLLSVCSKGFNHVLFWVWTT